MRNKHQTFPTANAHLSWWRLNPVLDKNIGLSAALPVLLLSIVLMTCTFYAAQAISVVAAVVITIGLLSAVATGRVLLRLTRIVLPEGTQAAAELLLGTVAMGVTMLSICTVSGCSAGPAFIAFCALGGLALFMNLRNAAAIALPSFVDLGALGGICVISCVWSEVAIQSFPRLRSEHAFYAWSDFFIHSAEIAQFAQFSGLGGKSILVMGVHLPLYHYASYMFPAAISGMSGLPALAIATSFWVLFGFICMGLGAYVLGVTLAGRAGLAGAAAIFLLPDASHYGMRHPFFGFHWLLQISPTGAYAVGISLLAIAYGVIALREKRGRPFWCAVALSLSMATFRAHIFVALAVSGIVLALVFWRPAKIWVWASVLTLLAFGALGGAWVAEYIPRAPHFFTGEHAPIDLLVTLNKLPIAASDDAGSLIASLPAPIALAVGLLLLTWAAFGLFGPLYGLGLIYLIKTNLHRKEDFIPLAILGAYCLMVVAFPLGPAADPDEFQHRPFVLTYAVLALWDGCLLARIVNQGLSRRWINFSGSLACCTLVVPFILADSAQRGEESWGNRLASMPVRAGLAQSAEYIRKNAASSDVVWSSEDDAWGILVGLSERAAFTSLSHYFSALDGPEKDLIRKRQPIRETLLRSNDFNDFTDVLQSEGIRWFVVAPDNHVAETITDKAEFRTEDGYAVLHIQERGPANK
jgi:hypothetical protein